jgi:hypothetical protein
VPENTSARYYSCWGPLYGPLLYADRPLAMGVFASPASLASTIGMAHPVGMLGTDDAPVAVFRLVVRGRELPRRYICIGQEFVDAATWEASAIPGHGPALVNSLAEPSFRVFAKPLAAR